MDIMEAIKSRHSVRSYTDTPIPPDALKALNEEIAACNKESGLNIQLITDEPKAFDSLMTHYGNFSGVKNYIALIGKKEPDLGEKCGYYGERIVLKAQQLGLNTCWVAMTYKKIPGVFRIEKGEKLTVVIAVGLGASQGVPHKSKRLDEISNIDSRSPQWFRLGVEAALLAPTAMNQQRFMLTHDGSTVHAKAKTGFYSKIDLGIIKYHFEVGAGRKNFSWK